MTTDRQPKAVRVSLGGLERLNRASVEQQRRRVCAVREDNDRLVAEMRARNGAPIDMDEVREADRRDLEARCDRVLGGGR